MPILEKVNIINTNINTSNERIKLEGVLWVLISCAIIIVPFLLAIFIYIYPEQDGKYPEDWKEILDRKGIIFRLPKEAEVYKIRKGGVLLGDSIKIYFKLPNGKTPVQWMQFMISSSSQQSIRMYCKLNNGKVYEIEENTSINIDDINYIWHLNKINKYGSLEYSGSDNLFNYSWNDD